jgi:NAD(P)-dependent dehydrogenase (short-subunit alcohol dehydrogenase family)
VNGEAAQSRAGCVQELGRKALAISVDATAKRELEESVERITRELGPVTTLVNAAGVNSGTPFFAITEEEWHRVLDIDLKSVFLACQVFGKAMVDSGKGGSIINIGSICGGPPLSKVFTYAVAKGGIRQITQFLARELAPHGIRVNAIEPGFFPAEQNRKLLTPERIRSIMSHTPMSRFGEPPEIVGAAIYLASHAASSYVTGSFLRVDGGFLAMTI